MRLLAGVLASALLAGLCATGGAAWLVAFVLLVPWLRALDTTVRTMRGALLAAWAMSVAFGVAVFGWFGLAIGAYAQVGPAAGLALLVAGAPLLQPQFFAFALVRQWAAPRLGRAGTALAAAAAWVATESLGLKWLGDTLGHGLHPAPLALRQAADLGGVAGLTLLLLLANEALAAALARRRGGVRAVALPLAGAAAVPLALAAYGFAALAVLPAPAGPPLRVALVQSNIVDYERLRREKGAGAVVREVLDVHFAMSYDAVERQRADAVLWSETVYPTTFGRPKSEAGAELDREILEIVNAAGVPFVFGTYERDDAGEYNAAAFVAPGSGLVGFYRKTRLFPFTEQVPAWLDGPLLRRLLPWAGSWVPGNGARVMPLRLADGREVPVLPLICLDDMDSDLAADGARLGAQALLVMSNDSWFSATAHGARLHLAASAFRSIETRLPQFRVTPDGISAVIDRTGQVVAASRIGERTLVIGELPAGEPARTLRVAWGDWVGRVAALGLVALAVAAAWRAAQRRRARVTATPTEEVAVGLPADVAVLSPPVRAVIALLRGGARLALLGIGAAILLGTDEALRSKTLAQIRTVGALVIVPELAAALLLRAFAARAALDDDRLVLSHGQRRVEIALRDVVAVAPWRVPLPADGLTLRLASGERHAIAHADPVALARAIADRGGASASPTSAYAQARRTIRRGPLDRRWAKFVVLPLLLAIPAFRLHQHIAYGSSFGEAEAFGIAAYLKSFALWWAAWAIGTLLCAAALRAAIEAGTLLVVALHPSVAAATRRVLERLGLAALYLGVPAWLAWRTLGG